MSSFGDKKKKSSQSQPQYRIGGIYHARIHRDKGEPGHYIIIKTVKSPEEVYAHLCTTSEKTADHGSVQCPDLVVPGRTSFVMRRPEVVHVKDIDPKCFGTIDMETAEELGIKVLR